MGWFLTEKGFTPDLKRVRDGKEWVKLPQRGLPDDDVPPWPVHLVDHEGITSFKLFMAYPGVYYADDGKILRAIQRKRGDQAALLLSAHIQASQAEVRKITLGTLHEARQRARGGADHRELKARDQAAAGASSASGASTKARSCKRGCGSSKRESVVSTVTVAPFSAVLPSGATISA